MSINPINSFTYFLKYGTGINEITNKSILDEKNASDKKIKALHANRPLGIDEKKLYMFDKVRFELIKERYGHYASWAVWGNEGTRPKDNIGDLSIFDLTYNPNLLKQLKTNIIFVGLNISRKVENPLSNFHDSRPVSMDYKIRYALKNTPYYGGYMTDIIKDFEQKIS
ncbi:MAG: hypothetical protein HQK76_15005, partial [Desulfobacterales bacterium]|nr:hypothetical protein [Desulfobacterales bacterium]